MWVYVKYFVIGMWLTFQSLWCDNSQVRYYYHNLRADFADAVELGESFAYGIIIGLVLIMGMLAIFFIWGVI